MIEEIFNIGLVLLVIDIFLIIFFIISANDIYSDNNRVGPGDGVFGPVLFFLFIIFPITLIQFCLFVFLFLKDTSITSYFGYSISYLSLIIIMIEITPFLLFFLILCIGSILGYFGVFILKIFPSIKKTKISKFLYKKNIK